MTWKKFFRQAVTAIFIIIGLFYASSVGANVQIFHGTGEFFMTDEDIDFAKHKAELSAQRDALEQVCFYVKSNSQTINGSLENDEIIVISTGILHVIDTKFEFVNDGGKIVIKSFVTAEIDVEELEKLLKQLLDERNAH